MGFKEQFNGMVNSLADLDRYLIGTANRLSLLQPEEVSRYQDKIIELKKQIDSTLASMPQNNIA